MDHVGCFGRQNNPVIYDGVFCPPKHPTTEYGVFWVYMVGVFLTWGVLGGHQCRLSLGNPATENREKSYGKPEKLKISHVKPEMDPI